jgi:hypothetical protein
MLHFIVTNFMAIYGQKCLENSDYFKCFLCRRKASQLVEIENGVLVLEEAMLCIIPIVTIRLHWTTVNDVFIGISVNFGYQFSRGAVFKPIFPSSLIVDLAVWLLAFVASRRLWSGCQGCWPRS